MSQPPNKKITTGTPGQSQTVFIVEGIKEAVIVTARGHRLRRRNARFELRDQLLEFLRRKYYEGYSVASRRTARGYWNGWFSGRPVGSMIAA